MKYFRMLVDDSIIFYKRMAGLKTQDAVTYATTAYIDSRRDSNQVSSSMEMAQASSVTRQVPCAD